MLLLEMSVIPMGTGESVSPAVARCVQLVEKSGLPYELHSMGTIVEGELAEVLDLLKRCIEATAEDAGRVSCTAKLDYRPGHRGRLESKIQSVRDKLV